MNAYQPYPLTKDSGIEWLGQIPAHWDVRRLKFLALVSYSNVDKHINDNEIPVRQCNYVDVYKNEHIINDLEFMEVTARPDEIRKFSLRSGDVIITKDSEDWKDIAVPALVPEPLDNVICGYHLALIRPNYPIVDGNYLLRSFQATAINYQYQVSASGITRYGLGKQSLGDSLILLPPLTEQRAISVFLDHETAHIDALIARKRELIDLLRQQRTAVISHAVTKGLDPNTPLKDSGVEWLGQIPAHWGMRRLKFLLKERLKYGANEVAQFDEPSWPRYIRITDIGPDGLLREDTFRSLPPEIAKSYLLQDGDILLARSGATVGKTFKYNPSWGTACFAGYLILCRVEKRIADSDFVYYFTQSYAYLAWKDASFIQATIQNISAEKYYNLSLGIPPIEEQRAIAKYLDRETARIDRLIVEIEASITLLQQQRISLISVAVTGKIDVRESM